MKHFILAIAVLIAPASIAGNFVERDTTPRGPQLREKAKPEYKERLTEVEAKTLPPRYKRLLDAIQKVETGGEKDPAKAVGDKGKARGWYQIHLDYYRDAQTQMYTNWGSYLSSCANRDESSVIVCLYWRKYKVSTDRDRALIHHYGPSALPGTETNKKDPDGYWQKVQKAMR